jgi:hypothetical protein
LDEFVRPVSVEADLDERMSQIGLDFSSSRLERIRIIEFTKALMPLEDSELENIRGRELPRRSGRQRRKHVLTKKTYTKRKAHTHGGKGAEAEGQDGTYEDLARGTLEGQTRQHQCLFGLGVLFLSL